MHQVSTYKLWLNVKYLTSAWPNLSDHFVSGSQERFDKMCPETLGILFALARWNANCFFCLASNFLQFEVSYYVCLLLPVVKKHLSHNFSLCLSLSLCHDLVLRTWCTTCRLSMTTCGEVYTLNISLDAANSNYCVNLAFLVLGRTRGDLMVYASGGSIFVKGCKRHHWS